MADKQIYELDDSGALAATDVFPVAQGSVDATKATFTKVGTLIGFLSGLASSVINLLTGTTIASASTINLDTATGNRVHISGTTTITAVTLTRGPRTLIFDGILTLTHHATNNNLPGGANITTAAGDRAIYESDGTTVYCVSYIRANGQSIIPNNLAIQGKTANYTVVAADHGTVINCTANVVTISVTAAATLGSGFWCWVINSSATVTDTVTIDPNSTETIDGVSTLVLRRGEGCIIESDGTNLITVAGKKQRGYVENMASGNTRPIASANNSIAMHNSSTASGIGSWAALLLSVASNDHALAHGYTGTASGAKSALVGGDTLIASGANSFAAGGFTSTASGASSYVRGSWAIAAEEGKYSDGVSNGTSVQGAAQSGKMVLQASTTDATPKAMTSNTSAAGAVNQFRLRDDSTYSFMALVTGRRTDANDESAGYYFLGVIDRNSGAATTAIVGSVTKTVIAEDTAAWDCAITADTTNGGIAVTVTGENAKSISWTATIWASEVTG